MPIVSFNSQGLVTMLVQTRPSEPNKWARSTGLDIDAEFTSFPYTSPSRVIR
jgi:hypothetical protein